MRLFVALPVPAPVRVALEAGVAPLRRRHARVRWTAPASWHLTLAFLGPQPVGGRLRAHDALRAATADAPACRLEIDGVVGRFGRRVLWAAVQSPDGNLHTLEARLRRSLAERALPVAEQPYRPHLTLARPRRGGRLPDVAAVDGPGLPATWTARTVALIESRPGPGGSVYRTLATWPLTDAGP